MKIDEGTEYNYEISGIEENGNSNTSASQDGHLFSVPVNTLQDFSNQSENRFMTSITAYALTESVASFKHRTFLKYDKVQYPYYAKTPNEYGKDIWMGGDGSSRPWSPSSYTHRTSLTIDVYWSSLDYGATKLVSDSHKYERYSDGTFHLLETKNAGTSGILVEKKGITSTFATFYVQHSVGLPFYFNAPPNIDYSYDLQLDKSGTTYINGSHDKFPWHEIYRSDNAGSWRTLYQFDPIAYGSNINYLFPTYSSKSIAIAK